MAMSSGTTILRCGMWLMNSSVSARIALSTIAGNALVEFSTRFCGRCTTLLIWAAVVLVAATVSAGLVDSSWPAVTLLLVATGAEGGGAPVQ